MTRWPPSVNKSSLMRTSHLPDFSAGFLLTLAGAILFLPLHWILAAVTAAIFHELCHLLALWICNGQVLQIRFGANGAVLHALPLPPVKSLFCTLAGPLGSLFLLLMARWFPRLAFCAAIQSAYNLLPLTGLDGGHALSTILSLFLPHRIAKTVCSGVAVTVMILIATLGLWGTFVLKLGFLPVLVAGFLITKGTNGKIPCKSRPLRVQ